MLEVLRDRAVAILHVRPEDVGEQTSLVGDLAGDSLSLVELTMDVEDEFGIELSEADVAGLTTIGGYADVVLAKLDR